MKSDVIKKILKKIKQYDTIVIARHVGADPDAICSQISLRDAIALQYPKKKVYAIGVGVSKFRKFGTLDRIDVSTLHKPLLITLDVPNFYRVDGVEELKFSEVIKIDHHPFEEDFGGIEWIEEGSSSTCQMIANLIFNTNLKMNENIASNLFLGIVSDSDRFLLSYTTARTFKVVSKLIDEYKIDFASLYTKLYERPINEIRFHGYLAENLTLTDNGLAYIKIMPEVLKDYKVDSGTPSNMINDFNYIKEVLVWIFVTLDDKNDIYKVNIRSRGPIINEIAEKYHGGGHKFASGARCKTIEEIDNLLKDLDEACSSYE